MRDQLRAIQSELNEGKSKGSKKDKDYLSKVTADDLEDILGRKVSSHDKAQDDNVPGVVTGLDRTSVGGEILFIEVTDMPGNGQVTLTLPIGGLKEKLIAAQRARIKKALMPKDNVIDLKDVPKEVKEELTIIAVETIEDVLKETLGILLPKVERIFNSYNFFTRNI